MKKLEALALEHAQSAELAAKLAGTTILMRGKASEKGTLFSGITEADVAHELSKIAGVNIPPTAILLGGHIKSLGSHVARLQLSDDVSAEVVVDVQPLS